MIRASRAISPNPTSMSQGFEAMVPPHDCNVLESAATPTIVSIGPMQILAVKTPQ